MKGKLPFAGLQKTRSLQCMLIYVAIINRWLVIMMTNIIVLCTRVVDTRYQRCW